MNSFWAGWCIYGCVILEKHRDPLVQANDLAKQLAHFKSYSADQLIDYLHNAEMVTQSP